MVAILKSILRAASAAKTAPGGVRIFSRRTIGSSSDHQVQIISSESIKPSSPTPKHLSTHKLSLFDQMFTTLYMPLVFFYSAKHQTSGQVCESMKLSLAKTLAHHYPFAGRLNDSFSVHCNDLGASFTEAHVDIDVSEFLQEPNAKLLQQLIPPSPQIFKPMINERELLAVQVNFFQGGEIAVGVCFSHGLADGSTISNFMELWGEINRGVIANQVYSVHDIVVDCSSIFPPQNLLEDQYFKLPSSTSNAVIKRFVFDGNKIAALKEKVNREMGYSEESGATRFAVVSPLIWSASIAAARERNKASLSHPMYFTNNLRKKIHPPLHPQSIGNIFRFAKAEWSAGDGTEVANLVGEVMEAKRKVTNGVSISECSDLMKDMNESREESRSLTLSSLVGFPYYEVDFGWGKPLWFSLGEALLPNVAILSSTSDGKGIEAFVILFKEDMDKFEENPCITANASSNPSIK